MASAKYTLHIPKADNLRQPLIDLALLAHQHLAQQGIDGNYVEENKRGFWKDYPEERMDHLISFQDDNPKNDSTFKQLGQHIGDIANQEAVLVTKEGKGSPEPWFINNKNFRPGEGAHPSVLAPQTLPAPSSLTYSTNRRIPSGRKARTSEERKNDTTRCCW